MTALKPNLICDIEDALGIQFSPDQKFYLMSTAIYMVAPYGGGKTMAYIIKLLLSDGAPLDLHEQFGKITDGTPAVEFRDRMREIHGQLNNAGIKTREVIF